MMMAFHEHKKLPTELTFVVGKPTHLARCELLATMLAGGFSHLLMVDSDMSFPHDAAVRLLERGRDLVGTVAQGRRFGVFLIENPRPVPGEADLLEVDMTGAGLALLSRRWCLRMASEYPQPFEVTPEMGEDVTAFQRWRDLGGRLFVDDAVRVTHHSEIELSMSWAEAQAYQRETGQAVPMMGDASERPPAPLLTGRIA
jgi:hypothetical protein